MEEKFSFDHLSSTEFENFCYELLGELGFINLNWRKGTGYDTSPADDGRDIECELERDDIDGSKSLEKWFVDAKHYKKGVPVDKIRNVLDWAEAERPDVVLIIVSNFLSNSTKRYLDNYKRNNNHPYKIKYWENPEIEKLTLNKRSLLKKYKISNLDFPFLDLMHPAHLWYIRSPPLNTLDYFFSLIENLDDEKRDLIFESTYSAIINPGFRKPVNEEETLGDLMIGEVNYAAFKTKILSIEDLLFEQFLVQSIVNYTLRHAFMMGDRNNMEEIIKNNQGYLEFLEKIISGELKPVYRDPKKNEDEINGQIKATKQQIENIPKRIEESYKLYNYFCDTIVSELFKQNELEVLGQLPEIGDL